MNANNFTLSAYFKRIGYTGTAHPDIASITEIMRCQLFSVPFENLDVQAGKLVSLVPEEIVEKIIDRNRGGYCYEVNGLFAMALESLGVPYQFVAARPMFYPVRRPKTHMAVVLTLNDREWLCDLGFGSYGIRAPICLSDLGNDLQQDFDTFRLSKDDQGNYLLQALSEGAWAKQYEFNLSPQEWIDFAPANYLNSRHPDSVFVQKLLIVLHRQNGRKILFGEELRFIEKGLVARLKVKEEDLAKTLSNEFGLAITSAL